jgi:sugar phosphate permease
MYQSAPIDTTGPGASVDNQVSALGDLPVLEESAGRKVYRWVILAVVWFGFLLSFVDRLIWTSVSGVAAPGFGLSVAALGSFVTSFYVGYVVSQALTGYLTDRLGARRLLPLALVPLGAFTFLFGSATSAVGAIALQSLMGLTAGADFAAGYKLILAWFNRGDRGKAVGLFMTATSLGVVATNFLIPQMLQVMTWTMVYEVAGIVTSIFGVVCFLALRDNPGGERNTPIAFSDLHRLITDRQFILVALAGFGGVWGTWGFAIWATSLMTHGLRFTTVEVGAIVGTFGIVAVLGKPAIGLLSDWLGGKRRILVMLDLFAFGALLLVTGTLSTRTQLWIVAPLLGLTAFMYSPLQNAMAAEAGGRAAGSGVGFSAAIGSIGTTIVPLVIGVAFQATQSFEVAFGVLAAGPLFGALCMIPVRDRLLDGGRADSTPKPGILPSWRPGKLQEKL